MACSLIATRCGSRFPDLTNPINEKENNCLKVALGIDYFLTVSLLIGGIIFSAKLTGAHTYDLEIGIPLIIAGALSIISLIYFTREVVKNDKSIQQQADRVEDGWLMGKDGSRSMEILFPYESIATIYTGKIS